MDRVSRLWRRRPELRQVHKMELAVHGAAMSAHYSCDACGKTADAAATYNGYAAAPIGWVALVDPESGETHDACSPDCLDKIADHTNNWQRSVSAGLLLFSGPVKPEQLDH